MASSQNLIRPLNSALGVAGFTQITAPGVVLPPRTLWHLSPPMLSGPDQGRALVALDVTPSLHLYGMFLFIPHLTLNGLSLSERMSPTPYWGTAEDFVDKALPQYQMLFELEDFYIRGNTAPGQLDRKPTPQGVAFR